MKKIIVLGLILFITISMVINVYAVSTFEMSLQSSKNEVTKGDEFEVDVKISNIQMDKGIIALGGRIEYDKDSLELIKLEGQNSWATPSYNENNGKFATDRGDYGTGDETIFKIIFKVKEESQKNVVITLVEASGSNGKDEVELKDIKTAITVKDGITKPDNPNTNTSTDNNTTNNNTTNSNTVNNDKNNTTNNNTNKNNVTSNNTTNNTNINNTNINNDIVANTNLSDTKSGIFPKTGANPIIFGTIGVLIIIAVIFYIRIRIIDSKIKK